MTSFGCLTRLQGVDVTNPIENVVNATNGVSPANPTVPGLTSAHDGTGVLHTVIGITDNVAGGSGGVHVLTSFAAGGDSPSKFTENWISNSHYTFSLALGRLTPAGATLADFIATATKSGSAFSYLNWIAASTALKPTTEGGTISVATFAHAVGGAGVVAPAITAGAGVYILSMFTDLGNIVTKPDNTWTQFRHSTLPGIGEVYSFWKAHATETGTFTPSFAFGPPPTYLPPQESAPAVITAAHVPVHTGEVLQVTTQTAWTITSGDTISLYERKAQRSTDGVTWTDIASSGSSGSAYNLLAPYTTIVGDRGKLVRYAERITATNGGVGPWSFSNPLQVSNVPAPDPTTPPVIISDGTPEVGEVASIGGAWDWNPTLTYQWRNNGVDITGETNPTYTYRSADRNDPITCYMGATNSEGGPIFYETPAVIPTDPSLNDYFVVPLSTSGLVGILSQRLYNLKTNVLVLGLTHSGISEIYDSVYRVAVQRPVPGAYLLVVEDGSGKTYNFRYEVPIGLG